MCCLSIYWCRHTQTCTRDAFLSVLEFRLSLHTRSRLCPFPDKNSSSPISSSRFDCFLLGIKPQMSQKRLDTLLHCYSDRTWQNDRQCVSNLIIPVQILSFRFCFVALRNFLNFLPAVMAWHIQASTWQYFQNSSCPRVHRFRSRKVHFDIKSA